MTNRPSGFRFHVHSADGRRSSEWVLTVGGRNNADVYLGPREMMSKIKVSLHESGECRLGPTEQLRERISWRFRSAHTSWFRDRNDLAPLPLFVVAFRDDQLIELEAKPHGQSMPIPIGIGQEIWVTTTILSAEAYDKADFSGMTLVTQSQLGDGSRLGVHSWERSASDGWMEEVATFEPHSAVEYPVSLSGSDFGYAIGETESRPFPIVLELAGSTIQAQSWSE